ncbi:MAG: capsular biosynthesis protein CpsI, partial [Rhodospirillaceae bacterium]|nr:capsular biosynthesis protein CpsI [Rhodospirillaceae bacterium]
YIDDIVEGVIRLLDVPPKPKPVTVGEAQDPSTSATAPFHVYNIGSDKPETLMRYIEVLEENLGLKAIKNMLPMQPGDVAATWADVDDLKSAVGFEPKTPIEEGIKNFVDWYREFYKA